MLSHYHRRPLAMLTQMRHFSVAPAIKTQFVLGKVRVCLEMPSRGFVWLFVNPTASVQQFAEMG